MTDENYVAELRSHGMLSTNQAADRIEALTAKLDAANRWGADQCRLHTLYLAEADNFRGKYAAAEAERDRLQQALEDIVADCEADYPPSHGAIKYAANLALKGETP